MASYEEIKKGITDAMSNPDTMETAMSAVLETIRADYDTLESVSKEYETAKGRIRDLQDTNHKLFLAQVGQPDDAGKEDPEPKEGPEVLKEFTENIISHIEEATKNG